MTIEAIKAAIYANDVNRLQQCLEARGAIDLNRVGYNSSILCWALEQPNISLAIIQVLLDLRNEHGQAVIDINVGCPIFNLFSTFNKLNSNSRADILNAILLQIGPHGELIKNIQEEGGYQSLLRQVVLHEDIRCLEIILEVRNRNGERAIDVNEVTNGTTVLDYIYNIDYIYKYVTYII